MSFILDALRKSEKERQRNTTPNIADNSARMPSNKSSVWLPLIAILLGVNLIIISIDWYINSEEKNSILDTLNIEKDEFSKELPKIEDISEINQENINLDSVSNSEINITSREPKLIDVPTLAELSLDEAIALPILNLDIHVYSQNFNERFVFINSTKYREADVTREGLVIDEINSLGVILKYENRRFLLTRE